MNEDTRESPVETNLYYCKARYYCPELCRFISPDSIEYLDSESLYGLDLYCYCMNNPVSYIDPSGHVMLSALIIGALIGATIGGVSLFVNQGIESGWNFEEFNVGLIISDTIFGALDGLLAASGIGAVGSFVLDAGIAFGQNVATALIMNGQYSLQDFQKDFITSIAISGISAGLGKFIDVKVAKGKWATSIDSDRLLGKWSSAIKTINSSQGAKMQARAAFNQSYVKKTIAVGISYYCGFSFIEQLF